jgi:hypothetical protein
MNDPASLVTLSGSALLAIALASAAGLKGWTDWLEVRRLELGIGRRSGGGGRIEVAELRKRVRRLEAIADGAEL